jgi:hypothetical protein
MLKNSIYQQANRKIKLYKDSKCEKCGKTGKLYRHHTDYNKPLDVIIFCYFCHRDWHTYNNTIQRKNYNKIREIDYPKFKLILKEK